MFKYYDIYDYNGALVDFTDSEWWAEEIASDYCGYFIERVEDSDEF